MPSPISRLIGVFVVAAALSVLTWFWTVPAVMSRSTYAFLVAFLLGGVGVTLVTWRNAQATGSMAQLLYETEVDPRKRGHV